MTLRDTVIPFLATALALASPAQEPGTALRDVVVTGTRPMKDIGVQRTLLDSAALKENVALSMADILTFNSSVFVKSYGRATLSTVAFRGTSPSHTQVTWNGLKLSSPMLGMTDFSMIPAYFIDSASLLHGTSSVNETGGGLGGLVRLSTVSGAPPGFRAHYVQGIGSFDTFDEYIRLTYGSGKWTLSTRAMYSSSPNDYPYINHDKKVNIYDPDRNIIGQHHPRERNRNGAYHDFNILQEAYFRTDRGDRAGLNVWLTSSDRQLPMITSDYGDEREYRNTQRETTLRSVLSWDRTRGDWRFGVKGGYIHSQVAYDYSREVVSGHWAGMTRSRSRINTFYAHAEGDWSPMPRLYLNADITANQHFVRSTDKNVILQQGDRAVIGYDQGRVELSAAVSAKWQPWQPLGLSAVLRQDLDGSRLSPVIPAVFADLMLWRRALLMAKASVSRNYRSPSLNDLYFLPGGNPALKPERGVTYDAGISFSPGALLPRWLAVSGEANWFDSRIDDWILWLPTTKGFFSPRNVRRVHAYGIETRLNAVMRPGRGWVIDLNASYSWTPSVNCGPKLSPADRSVGKQLPYVPRRSASLVGRATWRLWSFTYKWAHYSRRFTMSSNDLSLSGHLPAYFMSNVSLERQLKLRPIDLQLKLAVNNLFDEDYMSVLSRPMPGINFEFFIGITPHPGK